MRFSFTAALLLGFTGLVRAEEKPIQLFNGKDMSGWTFFLKDNGKMEDVWSVSDGIIQCKGKPIGYIRTEKDFTSYVLKVEWRCDPKKPGNSGVLLRMTGEDKVWPDSIECQLNSGDAGDIWNIGEYKMTVAKDRTEGRRTKKLKPSSEKPLGEWNEYEITVDGTNLELKVNGEVQNTATDVEVKPGKICLQSEGAPIEFRKIELTPIEKTEKASGAAVQKESPVPGWHAMGSGKWSLEDGMIVGRKSKAEADYGHLVSDDVYGDFTAKFKFKSVEGNSGFYYHSDEKNGELHGIQCEIDPAKDVGGIYESYGRQWVIKPTKEEVDGFFKKGDWNEMLVECKGDHIKVSVNGHTTVDLDDPKSKKTGHFALQMHGGTTVDGLVMFKDMEISGDKKNGDKK